MTSAEPARREAAAEGSRRARGAGRRAHPPAPACWGGAVAPRAPLRGRAGRAAEGETLEEEGWGNAEGRKVPHSPGSPPTPTRRPRRAHHHCGDLWAESDRGLPQH